MKRIILVAALLVIGAGIGHAQVATTELAPATTKFIFPYFTGLNTSTIAPQNPAALAWSPHSVGALGFLRDSAEDPTVPATYDSKGSQLGLRLVGSTFGLAIERQGIKLEGIGVGDYSDEGTEIQLSARIGDSISFGVGIESLDRNLGTNSTTIDRVQYGVTARVGSALYFGLAAYSDKGTDSAFPGVEVSRSATLYGVAVRTQGPTQWYLAIDVLDLPDIGFSNDIGVKSTTFTVQGLFGSWLVGASLADSTASVASGGPSDIKTTLIHLGWVPATGLSVLLQLGNTHLSDVGVDFDLGQNSLTVAWQF